MPAYYNEIDPYAAAWLRNLIAAGHIADGVVDQRSIVDVSPADLRDFTQCHFFAGVGVWSYALRRAGWPDTRPIWTGSCPCQPFSAAGKGGGFDDERHLWPAFHHLIRECRPGVVLGEQVASKNGLAWIDLVQADLEGSGYASGAVDLCAAGVGAPHIRQRLWWVGERLADADDDGFQGRAVASVLGAGRRQKGNEAGCGGRSLAGGLADADGGHAGAERQQCGREQRQQPEDDGLVRLADAERADVRGGRSGTVRSASSGVQRAHRQRERLRSDNRASGAAMDDARRPGPTNGLWRAADWLFCRDGKWRPVEPGTFPLAYGAASRVGRLRAYGNAIVAQCAEEFIRAYMSC